MILNEKVINPGELRTRITLQSPTASEDAGGFQARAYGNVATVWARWSNAHGSEAIQAAALGAEAPATVLIRYYAGLGTTWRVVKGSAEFEIVSVDNIQERGEFLELKVRRVKPG